jgi:16S rRNA (uracil1498-N3)-methyltransferase
MNRVFCKNCDIRSGKIIISDPSQLHHLKNVLRFKPGEPAEVFDDKGNEYSVKLDNISEKHAEFVVQEIKSKLKSSKVQIAVACAIPKKSKIDDIIDRLTQLGVDRIIPLMTARVIVKMDKAKESARQGRWAKIALAASKQSQRNTVTAIDPVTDFVELIKRSKEFDLKLIPTLAGGRRSIKSVLTAATVKSVLVLIGPEGDFTPEEVALAERSGFVPVTFGDLVFRVETACLYIASVLNYELR